MKSYIATSSCVRRVKADFFERVKGALFSESKRVSFEVGRGLGNYDYEISLRLRHF
jgi:hypothetical protein